MIRVILADDHTILRDGIRALIAKESDMVVVGQASNGLLLLELVAENTVDVVVLDVNMPLMDGLATMLALRQQFPAVRVLVLSMLEHEQYVSRMLAAGALGYALKTAYPTEIIHAIRMVGSNRPYLCSELGLNLLKKITHESGMTSIGKSSQQETAELSKREREVIQLIAEGLTNAEIADKLFTSKRTIETHRQNIIEKTQAKNTAA